jgi:hydroxymethylpyrimidine kinase/phosphomethylpyrimidine kinase
VLINEAVRHLEPTLHEIPEMALRETSLHLRPKALTIAGFDPSGGAGVLADVNTFAAFGFQPVAAITSITFQNTARVFGAVHQTGEAVRAQVLPLLEDATIVCAKIGMLPTRDVVLEVARLFRENDLPQPVADPVMMSSSGQRLMEDEALQALIKELLPLAQLVTPNIPEAETLTGTIITSETDMRRAAAIIRAMGAGAVLIKGGHLRAQEAQGRRQEAMGSEQWAVSSEQQRRSSKQGTGTDKAEDGSDDAIDVLDNEGTVTVFRERRVSGAELHGSGCILSAAIAAGLGKGLTLEDSVGAAKSFVLEAIHNSARV